MHDRKVVESRSIKSIRKIDSVPTQCIAVDCGDAVEENDLRKSFLAGTAYLVTHNTVLKELLSKWAPLTVEDAELNEAIKYDQSVVTEPDGEPIYVDGTTVEERMEADIQDRKDAMKASGEQAEEML